MARPRKTDQLAAMADLVCDDRVDVHDAIVTDEIGHGGELVGLPGSGHGGLLDVRRDLKS